MKLVFLFPFVLLLLLSCEEPKSNPEQVKNDPKSLVEFAQHFTLKKVQAGYELFILNPDTKKIEKKYLIHEAKVEYKLQADYESIVYPVEKMITLSSTHVGSLVKLNEENRIVGVSGMQYVYSPELHQKNKLQPIAEFTDMSTLNPERVFKTGAKLIIYSGFGNAPAQESKLNQLGIHAFPNYDWRETHPLGKAEWIKVMGALTGKMDEANAYFEKVKSNYIRLQNEAKKWKSKPMILSGILIGDIWYLPAKENYLAQLIHDAHAQNVGDQTPGNASATFNLSQVLEKNKTFDFWINPGFTSEKKLINQNSRYQFLRPFQQKHVYCYSHHMNFFWEYSAIQPDKVLADFIEIFHNPKVTNENLYFYKQIEHAE